MLVLSTQMSFSKTISFKGVCSITAGTISGKKYATLKCYKADEPGHYNIRATKWEWKDKEEYHDMARHAGRTFTCTFTRNGFVYLPQKHKNVDMTDCR
ncbi:hypothetical protein SAMN05877838_2152 [Hoeflea halophila]|uniref:Uncharacterized protein n=2 Tax=Hoeflea halophila TaxID=714899 RepID=A0A286IAW0_9HYPH|nr:hypothetical protein SAMN05877838_2152 [Hoeflea halophila]